MKLSLITGTALTVALTAIAPMAFADSTLPPDSLSTSAVTYTPGRAQSFSTAPVAHSSVQVCDASLTHCVAHKLQGAPSNSSK